MKLREIARVAGVLSLLLSGPALAGGQFTDQLPTYTPLLGSEKLPLDTGFSQGRQPQTIYATVNQMRALKLVAEPGAVTGASVTVPATGGYYSLDAAGTLAARTYVLPTSPENGTVFHLFSSVIVTALTLTPGGTNTINDTVTAMTANGSIEFAYNAATGIWYRLQ